VLELQRDALDAKVGVSTLLRKAMVIASKLNIVELAEWVNHELNGYSNDSIIPEYRRVHAELKWFNPYNGHWLPIVWQGNPPEGASRPSVFQSIIELEDLINRFEEGGSLHMSIGNSAAKKFMENLDIPTPPEFVVDRSRLVGVIESVRNLITNWTLKLEKQGILGENMTFTTEEIKSATQHRDIIIQNFQGIIGNVSHSSVTQNFSMNIRARDFDSLANALSESGVQKNDINELHECIRKDTNVTIQSKFGSHVASWLGKMVGKAAEGTWQISLGAAGTILAEALNKYYGL
jgi:hypothetical protein